MALFEDTFPPYHAFGSRNLSGGETGTDVAVLQTVFNQMLGVMNPPQGPIGPSVTVTGTYDAATKQAVRNIQSYFGIASDGIAGPDTYFLFGQGVGPHVTYGGPAYGSRTLRSGSSGGDVTVLQNRLNCFRYAAALGGAADGVFGSRTMTAVQQFQTDSVANGDTGLAVDGVVGSNTFDASWIYTYAGGRGIFAPRNGFDVVFVQVVLTALGYYSGPVHGYYDAATRAAVIAFQTANHIAADGMIGPATFRAIGQNNATPAPKPFPTPPITGKPTQVRCCITLTPTAALAPDPTEYDGVFYVDNGPMTGPDSARAHLMASAFLPDPSMFGAQYTAYGLSLDGASTPTPMTFCEAAPPLGMWTFLFISAAAGPVPQGNVTIAPITPDQVPGPAVMTGSFNCPLPAAQEGDAADAGAGGDA